MPRLRCRFILNRPRGSNTSEAERMKHPFLQHQQDAGDLVGTPLYLASAESNFVWGRIIVDDCTSAVR